MKEKIELGQIFCGEYSENCEVDRMSCPFSDCMAEVWAEKILSLGYHKTVWYKVKDNILPPINTHVRCVLNWCDILYYATGWYNDKGCWDYTDNANGDAELIAWAYLPEYKQ